MRENALVFARLLRASLYQDRGNHAAAARDIHFLRREGSRFATDLLRKVMRQTPSAMEAKRSSGNKEEAARVRAKQFFFCQCVAGAHQITDKNIEAWKSMQDAFRQPEPGKDDD